MASSIEHYLGTAPQVIMLKNGLHEIAINASRVDISVIILHIHTEHTMHP
jgi:hypothetical protein